MYKTLFVDFSLELYRRDFLVALSENNLQIDFWTFKQSSAEIEGIKIRNVSLLKVTTKNILIDLLNFPWLFIKLVCAKPKIVIAGDLGIPSLCCALYGKLFGVACLYWARLTEWTEREVSKPKKIFRRILLTLPAAIIANGKSGEEYLRTLTSKNIFLIHQVPNVINTHKRRNLNIKRKESKRLDLRLAYVGRVVLAKGLMQLMNEIIDFSQNELDIELKIIGDGPDLELVKQRANDFRFPVPVRFLGWKSGYELAKELSCSDALIFPTLQDEWGMVVVEALSLGLPILSSVRAGAAEELLTDGREGFFFDPKIEGSLASAVLKFSRLSEKERKQMSRSCLDLLNKQKLHPKQMAKDFERVINLYGQR